MSTSIPELLQAQRKFFATGKTRDRDFRIQQLQSLEQAIVTNQDKIVAAVQSDLGRAPFEAYFEIATLSEVKLFGSPRDIYESPQTLYVATRLGQPRINTLPADLFRKFVP